MLDSLAVARTFADDFGEDWVVPRAAIRYVVVRESGPEAILTAFGPQAQIVGERHFPDGAQAMRAIERLASDGSAEPVRDLPEPPASATRFLDERLP